LAIWRLPLRRFDCLFRPIIRVTNGKAVACDPLEWVEFFAQSWFYNDGCAPRDDAGTKERLETLMAAIPELGAEVRRREFAERQLRQLPPRRWSADDAVQS
jgi:hypothetical protein